MDIKNLKFSAEEIDSLLNKIKNLDLSNIEASANIDLSIGRVETVDGTTEASASIVRNGDSYKLNLSIPKGEKGDKGNNGGTPSFSIGTISTGSTPQVIMTGDFPNYILNFVLPTGGGGSGSGGGELYSLSIASSSFVLNSENGFYEYSFTNPYETTSIVCSLIDNNGDCLLNSINVTNTNIKISLATPTDIIINIVGGNINESLINNSSGSLTSEQLRLLSIVQTYENNIKDIGTVKTNVNNLTNNKFDEVILTDYGLDFKANGINKASITLPMVVDSSLSTDSTNPIQNKIVTNALNDINSQLDNIENKKITTITPELFGAKGDGVTDDTEAIKLTFNKARELDKEIKFPFSKSYIVNDSININYPLTVDFNNCKFICDSKTDEFYLLNINNTENVVIKNFKAKSFINKTLYLDIRNGNTPKGLGSNVYAIYIRFCKNVIIENIDIEDIAGIGGFRNEKISIKNYKGYNLEMPFYFGNVKNMNIDNFNVTFNDTGVSYFYHGFYFNHVMENVKIQNGEINNPHTKTVSDCFNFLTSNDKVEGEDMKDIRVNNVKCYGKFNQFTRLAECSNVKFNNIIFNSPVCTNLVEHCGTVFNQYCLIENSEFNVENINNDDRGLIKESFISTVNFMTEFRNCKLNITTAQNKGNLVITKYNVKFINCDLKISPLHTEFNIAQQGGQYVCSFYSINSTFTITDYTVKTIIAVGDFSTTSNIKLINNIFDCNCKGGFCFYNKGGIFANNIISNGNNIKQDTSDAILSNNVILSGAKS